MQRIEDILTGLMLIGSTIIVSVIAMIGIFFFLIRSNFIPLTLIFVIGFLILYTIRSIVIGFNLIFHGRYQDEMTLQDNRRYSH